MTKTKPLRWLASSAATGVKDLPSNAAWAVSKAVPSPVEQAAGGAKNTALRMTAAVQDLPASDSLNSRLQHAREATERAQRAEHKALAEATQAKQLADEHKARVEEGHEQIRQTKAASAEDVKRRVAEVRRTADAMVEDERAKAQAEADDASRKVAADVHSRIEKSRTKAEQAQERAQDAIADAREKMAEARRLADEAAQEAHAAAAEAQRRAEELAGEARRQAGESNGSVVEADMVQQEAVKLAAAADEEAAGSQNGQRSGSTSATKSKVKAAALTKNDEQGEAE